MLTDCMLFEHEVYEIALIGEQPSGMHHQVLLQRGFPHAPTLTTCQKRRYLNTSLCYLWCASEGVSPYYLLPQVVRVLGSAGDPSAVTSDDSLE